MNHFSFLSILELFSFSKKNERKEVATTGGGGGGMKIWTRGHQLLN